MAGILLNRSRQVPAEDTPAFGGIAERFRRAGDLDRAITLCREGLKKFPDQLSARVTLGWSLLDKGQYDEARAELERVLRRAPDNLAAIRGLAELHDRSEGAMPSMDERESWRSEAVDVEQAIAASDIDETSVAAMPPAAPTDDPFAPISVTLASASAQPSPEVLHTADAAAAAATAEDLLVSHQPEPVEIENPAAAAMAAGLELDVTPFDPGPLPAHAALHRTDTDETETADLMAALQSMTDGTPAAGDILLDVASANDVESLIDAASETPAAFEIEPAVSAASLSERALDSDVVPAHAASLELSDTVVHADALDTSAAPDFVDEDPLEAAALAELLQTASELSTPDVEHATEPAIADLFALEPAAETTLAADTIDLASASHTDLADLALQQESLSSADAAALSMDASIAESDVLALEASLADEAAPTDVLAPESVDHFAATFGFSNVPDADDAIAEHEALEAARPELVEGARPELVEGASLASVEAPSSELVEGTFALEAQDVTAIEASDPAGLLSGLPDTVEAPGITDRTIASIEDAAALEETAFVPDLNYTLDLADPVEVAAA
ncbi:MAG TPA: tetratricopeptide repeat protein, partial [Vicinamibacterales bacterium]|nr:tetratricopeptide repeat protein [Vicinamibacterales bacterium]